MDADQVKFLYHCLLKANPTEVTVIREALKGHQQEQVEGKKLAEGLWGILKQPKKDEEDHWLQAASALAIYEP